VELENLEPGLNNGIRDMRVAQLFLDECLEVSSILVTFRFKKMW
jgi:hypothetical protein